MKITAFAASSSRNSINKALVTYASGLLHGADVQILDLNDFELPLPSFHENFDLENNMMKNDESQVQLQKTVNSLNS